MPRSSDAISAVNANAEKLLEAVELRKERMDGAGVAEGAPPELGRRGMPLHDVALGAQVGVPQDDGALVEARGEEHRVGRHRRRRQLAR